jgi:hypothetical protein
VPELEQQIPSRRYFRKLRQGRRTHQIHLVERPDVAFWDRHVLFAIMALPHMRISLHIGVQERGADLGRGSGSLMPREAMLLSILSWEVAYGS